MRRKHLQIILISTILHPDAFFTLIVGVASAATSRHCHSTRYIYNNNNNHRRRRHLYSHMST